MKRGISPLIATVLLVAFTLAVAGVYQGWIMTFTSKTTKEVGEHSEKRVTCTYGGIALDDLRYNKTTFNISGTAENTDVIPLGDLSLEIFYNDASREKYDLNFTLEPDERNIFNLYVVKMNTTNYDKIRLITNCSDVYDETTSSEVSESY